MQPVRQASLSRRDLRAPWDALHEVSAIVLVVVLVCFVLAI
jgi:hypothetical protein